MMTLNIVCLVLIVVAFIMTAIAAFFYAGPR